MKARPNRPLQGAFARQDSQTNGDDIVRRKRVEKTQISRNCGNAGLHYSVGDTQICALVRIPERYFVKKINVSDEKVIASRNVSGKFCKSRSEKMLKLDLKHE